MKVEFEASQVLLRKIAENLEKLRAAGVNVKLVLDSDGIVGSTRDESGVRVLKLRGEQELVEAFDALQPAATLQYSCRTEDGVKTFEDVEVHFVPCASAEVVCPLCGEKSRYCYHFPAVDPPRCPGCGATVFAEFGDLGDVLESVTYMLPIDYDPEVLQIDGRIARVRDNEGREIVAVRISRDDEDDMHVWFVFWQNRSSVISAEDVLKIAEDGKTVGGTMVRFEGEYVVKKVKPMGRGSGGTYLPASWIGSEVLALRLPEKKDL